MCMYVTLAMTVSTGTRDIPLYISHVIYIYKVNIVLSLHLSSSPSIFIYGFLSLSLSLSHSLTLYPNIDALFSPLLRYLYISIYILCEAMYNFKFPL